MRVLIRGAGDLASGIALRLHRSGMEVAMTDIAAPTTIRRTVAFSQAIVAGEWTVEDVAAVRCETAAEGERLMAAGRIPVFVDPECLIREELRPDALVDAILAKRNLGTTIQDAPVVVGVGPGFTAGVDCHAAVETMRGHTLGRVLYEGSPLPNTNMFTATRAIGDKVEAGDIVGMVAGKPMVCTIGGVLRGLLSDGVETFAGMKAGDVDPRGVREYCFTASDKALAIGGGVLEAILGLSGRVK